jgi:hypothetical protein
VMAIARNGDPIVCSKGHVAGHLLDDLTDTDLIPADGKVFGIDFDKARISGTDDGHECSTCGERVTTLRDGHYQIRAANGWFGRTT